MKLAVCVLNLHAKFLPSSAMGTLLNWVLNEVGKKFNGKLAISLKW